MRKILFLLSVFTLLVFAVTNCDDTGANIDDGTGTTPPDTTQTDTTKTDTIPQNNSLVGEWRKAGSTTTPGIVVIFTDTTVNAWNYGINYALGIGERLTNHWQLTLFYDNKYLLNEDTLIVSAYYRQPSDLPPFKTHFIFHSEDTLYMQNFVIIDGYDPLLYTLHYSFVETILHRYIHDNTMSLVGEWYEAGSADTLNPTVIFTDTTVTALNINNVRYLLEDNTLVLLNHNLPVNHNPFKTHFMFHSNDTLSIRYFAFSDIDIAFPGNARGITLYRRYNYDN